MNDLATTDSYSTALAYTASEYSTLTVADKETKKMALNAMNDAQSLNEVTSTDPDHVFSVVGAFTRPGVRRARKQGDQDMPCTNTTILCADGTAYMTQSEGIRRAMDSFVAAGIFDDGEPVDMKVSVKTIPGGNTIKTLVLV